MISPFLAQEEFFEFTTHLVRLGKKRGYILIDELNNFLPDGFSPKDIDAIIICLKRLNIGYGKTEEDGLTAKENIEPEYRVFATDKKGDGDDVSEGGSEGDKFNDPVRMYLKEMGTVPLLKREDEVEIAKRIEIGVRSVMRSLSRSRLAVGLLIEIGKMLKDNPGKIREVVGLSDELDDDEDAENTSATQHVHHQFEKLLTYDAALQDLLNLKVDVAAGIKSIAKRRKLDREIIKSRAHLSRQVRKLGLNSLASQD